MSSSSVEVLLKMVMNSGRPLLNIEERSGGQKAIFADKQILIIALWYMATPECHWSISDRFDVTKSSAFRITRWFFLRRWIV